MDCATHRIRFMIVPRPHVVQDGVHGSAAYAVQGMAS